MSEPEVEILDRLADAGFEFVLVGGMAAILHGSTVFTEDIDIAAPFSEENAVRLLSTLGDLHPFHRMTPSRRPLTESPATLAQYQNLYLATDAGELDILGQISGVGDFEAILRESGLVELEGRRFRVLGLAGLIRSKEALNRPKDRAVLMQLRAIQAELTRGDPGRSND